MLTHEEKVGLSLLVTGILIGFPSGVHVGIELGPKSKAWVERQVHRLFDRGAGREAHLGGPIETRRYRG